MLIDVVKNLIVITENAPNLPTTKEQQAQHNLKELLQQNGADHNIDSLSVKR